MMKQLLKKKHSLLLILLVSVFSALGLVFANQSQKIKAAPSMDPDYLRSMLFVSVVPVNTGGNSIISADNPQKILGYKFTEEGVEDTPSLEVAIDPSLEPFGDVAFDSEGRFWGVSNKSSGNLYEIDLNTGEAISIKKIPGTAAQLNGLNSLTGYNDDLLVGKYERSNYLYNPNTEALTTLVNSPIRNGGDYMNIDGDTALAFLTNRSFVRMGIISGELGTTRTILGESFTIPISENFQGVSQRNNYIYLGGSSGKLYRSSGQIDANFANGTESLYVKEILNVGDQIGTGFGVWGMATYDEAFPIAPELTTEKTGNKSSAMVGDTVSYNVKTTVEGRVRLLNPKVTDVLPEGMEEPTNVQLYSTANPVPVNLSKDEANANSDGQYYTWDAATRTLTVYSKLAVESMESLFVTYDSKILTGNDGDLKTNTAITDGSNTSDNLEPSSWTVTIVGEPEITLTKSADQAVVEKNDPVNYVIYAQNNGNATLEEPVFKDYLPEGMGSPNNITLQHSIGGVVNTNTLSAPNTPVNGDYYTWDETTRLFTVYSGTSLAMNDNVRLSYTSEVTAGSDGETKRNEVKFSGKDTGEVTAAAEITIRGNATIELTKKSMETNVSVGQDVHYQIVAKNNGNAAASGVVFKDYLPEGMSKPQNIMFTTDPGGAELPENVSDGRGYYTWDEATRLLTVYIEQQTLPAGFDFFEIQYTSKVTAGVDGEIKRNEIEIYSEDELMSTAAAEVTISGEAEIELTKDALTSVARVDEEVAYSIKATNSGNAILNNLVFKDTLPEGMDPPESISVNTSHGNLTISENTSSTTGYYTWDEATRLLTVYFNETLFLGIGDSYTLLYYSKVTSGMDGEVKRNEVELYGDNELVGKAFAEITITGNPDITLKKTVDRITALVGETVQYQIQATNKGNAPINEPVFKDQFPLNIATKPETITYTDGQGITSALGEGSENMNERGQYFTWDEVWSILYVYDEQIGIGETVTIQYSSIITNGVYGDIMRNEVTLTSANGQEITASAEVTISGVPNATLTKTADPTIVSIGDPVYYNIKAQNTGTAPITGVIFSDILPEGMAEPRQISFYEPTDLTTPPIFLEKGEANANENGQYYTWDEETRKLSIYSERALGMDKYFTIDYETELLSGNNNEVKENVVTLTATNLDEPLEARARITVEGAIQLNIKQEILNTNPFLVQPSQSYLSLANVALANIADVSHSYTMVGPSYRAFSNGNFESISLQSSSRYLGYKVNASIPQFYRYAGYQLTATEANHNEAGVVNGEIPILDYSTNKSYWLTIYLEPKLADNQQPPYYSGDSIKNSFGTIQLP